MSISKADLILNKESQIYHLKLRPGELASTIILVGDQRRVPIVSKYFDQIDLKVSNREYCTHTGRIGSKRISVVSTGVGVGNIDIVLNEIDALFNIDFTTRMVKASITPLTLIRLGTAGGLQTVMSVGSVVISEWALGLDGMPIFYQSKKIDHPLVSAARAYCKHTPLVDQFYVADASIGLLNQLRPLGQCGITLTCPGFYGPQYRQLRVPVDIDLSLNDWGQFDYEGRKILNFEMETSAIYMLSNLLGHRCCSISLLAANRITSEFIDDLPSAIDHMISNALSIISGLS